MNKEIRELDENIRIKKKNFKPIAEALTAFAKSKLQNKTYYSTVLTENVIITDKNAANIYFGKDITEINYLTTILSNMLFQPELNNDGDLVKLLYVGENLYNAFPEFFDIIAPFVEPGSYISFQDENREFFQYAFDGKTMSKKIGEIVWKD